MRWVLFAVAFAFGFDVVFRDDPENDFEIVDGDREAEKKTRLAFDLFESVETKSPTARTRSPTTKSPTTKSPTFLQTGTFSKNDLHRMNVSENESWGDGVVFVLDTGCQIDRFPNSVEAGPSFVFDEPDSGIDLHGHGTHVAGLISAVAPKSKIVCVRVFDKRGDGFLTSIVSAFRYVSKRCAKSTKCVLNLSGGTYESKILDESATRLVTKRNVAVVAASGNWVNEKCLSPAKAPWVVSVGASDRNEIAYLSAFGPCVDVFAPGVSVPSFAPIGWAFKSGTSMSTAYVSGIVSHLRKRFDSKHLFAYVKDTSVGNPPIVQASNSREHRFVVESEIERDWFRNCVEFVSDEFEIGFENQILRRTNNSLSFGNVVFVSHAASPTRIVWDNSGGAVFENDVYVAKWNWKRNKRMSLRFGTFDQFKSCVDVVPPHEPCPMRSFSKCTPPCVWTTKCNRPTACPRDQASCAKFKRCAWRNKSCVLI